MMNEIIPRMVACSYKYGVEYTVASKQSHTHCFNNGYERARGMSQWHFDCLVAVAWAHSNRAVIVSHFPLGLAFVLS